LSGTRLEGHSEILPTSPSRRPSFLKVAQDLAFLSPQLKQGFFIGTGTTKAGASRRFLVPKGATRPFLGVMDGFSWWNNQGGFRVAVTVQRTDVDSNMFSVDSQISFAGTVA
jgi:hypothetical protein